MPRYMVHRSWPEKLELPVDSAGAEICRTVVENNSAEDVNLVHSYVSADKRTTFCIYDGPTPEAIRKAATRNGHPVDEITEVRVLDPSFYA